MKKLLLLCFVLLPLLIRAQSSEHHITYITKDSLPRKLFENWKFLAADSPAMALPEYNDTTWELVSSQLWLKENPKKESEKFNGIGWLRLNVRIDSSLVNVPLALEVTHYGASEIYVDGSKIMSYGNIKGKDSSVYYDPQRVPLVFYVHAAGLHVIAVRYANYNSLQNSKTYSGPEGNLVFRFEDVRCFHGFDHEV